ncbi:MAG: succinate-semialdehyde dehydrogenase / glutarate-semialdehyde dehydrogenase, partial [Acetobacteraceae bacterium]|nr:succinate-semialdehyde dehydrogenase / glutarate-semialdehyde dehydrogenase [Acetobacteraceae bacterium]
EELFGPVAAIVPVRDEAEEIATANDFAFGLGGGVFTRDLTRGGHIAEELIESGSVFVNEHVCSEKWSGKFGQFDKWIFPPERGVIAADRREENDQTGTPDTRSGIQGEGGDSGDQR